MERIDRFQIQLVDFEPAIWRRIAVPVTISLKGLHDVILAAQLQEIGLSTKLR